MEKIDYKIINNRMLLQSVIGKGSFCELYLGRDLCEMNPASAKFVAVKLQTLNTERSSIVKHEAEILKNLSGLDTIPRYIDHGLHEGHEYLIMDLLGGEDMSNVRDRARRQCGVRLVPLPVTIYCMKQMLLCLKDVHSRGYVHRDVKPANFVRKSKDSTEFCAIDFGLTRKFIDKNGQVIPKRESVEFRGTTMYASPRTIDREEQGPRDDLYSLAFVLCDFLCGALPWAEASRDKNKPEVARLKKLYVVENPALLAKYVRDTARIEAVRGHEHCKQEGAGSRESGGMFEWPFDSEFDPCPPGAENALVGLFQYLAGLKYEDSSPDYGLISGLLDTMVEAFYTNPCVQTGYSTVQAPGDLAYTCHGCFSWTKEQSLLPIQSDKLVGDDVDVHEAIRVRGGHLRTHFEETLSAHKNRSSGEQNPRAVATRPIRHLVSVPEQLKQSWLALQHDLIGVRNSSVIHSSTIALVLDIARSADYFLGNVPLNATYRPRSSSSGGHGTQHRDVDSSTSSHSLSAATIAEQQRNHQDWKEVMSLHRAIYNLTKLEHRTKRRCSTGGMGPPLKRPHTGNMSFSSQKMSVSSHGS